VPALRDIANEFETCDFSAESLKAATERVGEKHQVKLGKLQAPLRVAITGRQVGPPLFEPIELLGRQEALRRIQSAITRAS
jgi:glutamyl-tRNA synthetase